MLFGRIWVATGYGVGAVGRGGLENVIARSWSDSPESTKMATSLTQYPNLCPGPPIVSPHKPWMPMCASVSHALRAQKSNDHNDCYQESNDHNEALRAQKRITQRPISVKMPLHRCLPGSWHVVGTEHVNFQLNCVQTYVLLIFNAPWISFDLASLPGNSGQLWNRICGSDEDGSETTNPMTQAANDP